MRLIAVIEDPDVARRIHECLALPARAPPLGEARELKSTHQVAASGGGTTS